MGKALDYKGLKLLHNTLFVILQNKNRKINNKKIVKTYKHLPILLFKAFSRQKRLTLSNMRAKWK